MIGSLVVAGAIAGASLRAQEAPRPSFPDWLSGVRAEALARGIRPEVLDQAFGGMEEPLPIVIDVPPAQREQLAPPHP